MMSALRRIAMGIGGTVVIALVIAVAAPKTVRAVVSALVTVTNTAANPVLTQSVDDHALHSFQEVTACTLNSVLSCHADFPTFPAGMTAVVQDVSGACTFDDSVPAPPPSQVTLSVEQASPPAINGVLPLLANFQGVAFSHSTYVFGRQTTLYAVNTSTSQQQLTLFVAIPAVLSAGTCTVQVSGYYVPNGL